MNVCKKWGWGLQEGLESGVRERRDEEEGLGTACSQEVSVLPVPQAGAAPGSGLWVSAPTFSQGLHQEQFQ